VGVIESRESKQTMIGWPQCSVFIVHNTFYENPLFASKVIRRQQTWICGHDSIRVLRLSFHINKESRLTDKKVPAVTRKKYRRRSRL
jgi:hypothetical protein